MQLESPGSGRENDMLLDHRVTVTFKADPPLLAFFREWLASRGGMSKADVDEVVRRVRESADTLHDLKNEPPSPST